MSRTATVERQTKETRIRVELDLDGTGKGDVKTPIGFLSHMVEQISRHGLFDLTVDAEGDVEIDGHHTTEDLGIVFGTALRQAIGDGSGIHRYGYWLLPMDETRVKVALDLSGRSYFVWDVPMPKAKIGDFDTELAEVFFEAVARSARINLHVALETGQNLHHIVEACFKAFARALRVATAIDPRVVGVASTKGTLA
ncbi:MAG: imidazoleglycerol-phosphate dehydratase HisB [Polyangiaceae bacterium]